MPPVQACTIFQAVFTAHGGGAATGIFNVLFIFNKGTGLRMTRYLAGELGQCAYTCLWGDSYCARGGRGGHGGRYSRHTGNTAFAQAKFTAQFVVDRHIYPHLQAFVSGLGVGVFAAHIFRFDQGRISQFVRCFGVDVLTSFGCGS